MATKSDERIGLDCASYKQGLDNLDDPETLAICLNSLIKNKTLTDQEFSDLVDCFANSLKPDKREIYLAKTKEEQQTLAKHALDTGHIKLSFEAVKK
ncbi:hypothetical protein J7384_17140 [Endozoicomonas sp. G2_1]|uniref:hypothetical protein n=1 Tax=Endozoicomonas sp. G2_1 TaxID=2821091 RepID=UPI001ADB47EA|nr:hypothetical protein [Endozoicomonas sp. G2_1]MBO9492090.1 hypothetical protein [Endozoicomonas sp. G2_1]